MLFGFPIKTLSLKWLLFRIATFYLWPIHWLSILFQALHNIDPLTSEFKETMEKTDALMSKFTELCQVESNVRKTNFYRAKHALLHVEKKKTQIQQLIRRFTEMVLQIVGCRNTSTIEGPHATDWLYALECVDSFNKVSWINTCKGDPRNTMAQ